MLAASRLRVASELRAADSREALQLIHDKAIQLGFKASDPKVEGSQLSVDFSYKDYTVGFVLTTSLEVEIAVQPSQNVEQYIEAVELINKWNIKGRIGRLAILNVPTQQCVEAAKHLVNYTQEAVEMMMLIQKLVEFITAKSN